MILHQAHLYTMLSLPHNQGDTSPGEEGMGAAGQLVMQYLFTLLPGIGIHVGEPVHFIT